jgi:aminoglycoside/choline kinase family phosphotransferase
MRDVATDGEALALWAVELLNEEDLEVSEIAADAGTRTYLRVRSGDGRSWLAMALADRATDYLAVPDDSHTEIAFLTLGRFLAAHGWPVPRIHHCDQARDWLLIEDFGDVRLESLARAGNSPRLTELYVQAAALLVDLQALTNDARIAEVLAVRRALDRATLEWELWHGVEWGLEARRGCSLTPGDRRRIAAEFTRLTAELAGGHYALAHRDYHSRNLMVLDARSLGVIDFQDALLAPAGYDLASLLFDSYAQLDDGLIERCVVEFHTRARRRGLIRESLPEFRRGVELLALQRSLKVLGRFVWLALNWGQRERLDLLSPVIARIRVLLARHEDLASLRALLERYAMGEPG